MKKLVSHLSYANVIATIALFIALGGGAYAVGLKKDSVGPKQIKANAVTGIDANEATFGQVPNAANAGNADTLDGINSTAFAQSGSEVWHEVGTAGEPPFAPPESGCPLPWVNYANGFNTAAFYRDRGGLVHLKGLVKDGFCTVFVLPVGYRPAAQELHAVASDNAFGRVDIAPLTGRVTEPVGSRTWLSLDGITFRCQPSGVNGCP